MMGMSNDEVKGQESLTLIAESLEKKAESGSQRSAHRNQKSEIGFEK